MKFIKINEVLYPIPDIKFGIEIECYNLKSRGEVSGRLFTGVDITRHNDKVARYVDENSDWIVSEERTCKNEGNLMGWEYISPKLEGEEGVKNLVEFCDRLNKIEPIVNEKTGLHINIDTSKWSHINCAHRSVALYLAFHKVQDIMFAMCDISRQNNLECSKIEYSEDKKESEDDFVRKISKIAYYSGAISAKDLKDKGNIEFRFFNGNLNSQEILYQTYICSKMVSIVMEKLDDYSKKNPKKIMEKNIKGYTFLGFVKNINFNDLADKIFSDKKAQDYWNKKRKEHGHNIELKNCQRSIV